MIVIPDCLRCINLIENSGMKCKAFPDGIPSEVRQKKIEEGCTCNQGIGYKKRNSK